MKCPSCDHENIQGHEFCDNCGLDLAGLDMETLDVDPAEPALARQINSLAVKTPVMVSEETTVSAAVKAMHEHHQGCVFVIDHRQGLLGVFTERDLTVRVAAHGRDPETTHIKDVMTPRPVSLRPQDPLAWALHRMGVDGYRHLPIVDEARLIGVLSARVVLAALAEER